MKNESQNWEVLLIEAEQRFIALESAYTEVADLPPSDERNALLEELGNRLEVAYANWQVVDTTLNHTT